ncbi:LWR-salt protein [Haloplanus halophilus]|uniref:LWR-salt protein n=1 Tax=Haloplanus halophilus TaxID=2949993 RepID=UPI00203D8A07|nr:LWR-salt protein [Haloplanus sp. GDY1]
MDAAYVFRVTFRLDPTDVTADPDTFETVVTSPAADPGTEGWLFFRDALWRGEVSDEGHLRDLAEDWLSVPVTDVTFSELRTDEAYLDALRAAVADDPAFDDPPREVLHAHLGSSVRVTD